MTMYADEAWTAFEIILMKKASGQKTKKLEMPKKKALRRIFLLGMMGWGEMALGLGLGKSRMLKLGLQSYFLDIPIDD